MVTAEFNQEFDSGYEVSFREMPASGAARDVSSKDRFRAKLRYTRGGKNRQVSGAHRRRDKRNYL